jgi:hypothetical protein
MPRLGSSLFTFFFIHLSPYLQTLLLLEKPLNPLLAIRATAAQQSPSLSLTLAAGPDSLFTKFPSSSLASHLDRKVGDYHGGQPCHQIFKNSGFSRAAPPVANVTFSFLLSREPQKFAFPFLA